MIPVQTIARRRLLTGLVAIPAALVAIPGHALALVSPKRAAWNRADAAFRIAENRAAAAFHDYDTARRAYYANGAKVVRECPPFPTEAMTVRDPERVAAFNARCKAQDDEDGRGHRGPWAQFVLSGEPNIDNVFADAPAERAASEAHKLAEAQEIEAARAMILTPSPSAKVIAYKMQLASEWRMRGIAWATTAYLAERTTRGEVVALADRNA